MTTRTALAKGVFKVSGLLFYVKTYQRFWLLDLDAGLSDLLDSKRRHDGRHWSSCALSMRLLGWSENIDPQHWDHWALVHDDEPATRCRDCGGYICARKERM